MKTVVTVNTSLPTVEDMIAYHSGKSLVDYDIILFDPVMPYEARINFTGGGSCVAIEGTQKLKTAMSHWSKELTDALKAGKTIFIILNEEIFDSGAHGSVSKSRSSREYQTSQFNNYDALPIKLM